MRRNAIQEFTRKLEADPVRVRKSYLSAVVALTGAQNAYLVLPGHLQHLISWKKQPSLADPNRLLRNFENRSRNQSWSGNHWLARLKWRKGNTGILILYFRRKRKSLRPDRAIESLNRIYACWEGTQQLQNAIHSQQKTLQNLTAESAAVAQDYLRLTQQMHVNQARMQSITKGILRTQEEERAKISRDLHDGIGQELTALKMNLDVLADDVEKGLSPENQPRWSEVRSIAEQALQDVRELSRLLRPRMLDDLGLFPTLRWYVRSFIKRVNINVDLELDGEEERLDAEKQTILFRVIQEALNNVAKHSRATSAAVRLQCREQEASLQIQDDGIGFDPEVRHLESGSGLAGMRDRVQLYKGRFSVRSEPAKGTHLEISLPL